MTRSGELLKFIDRALKAAEGRVLEWRGEALLPGSDASAVAYLDRITALLSQVRNELAALQSWLEWRDRHSRGSR